MLVGIECCTCVQVHSIISELLFPSEGSDERIVGPYIPTFYQFFDTISHSESAEVHIMEACILNSFPCIELLYVPCYFNPGLSMHACVPCPFSPHSPRLPITSLTPLSPGLSRMRSCSSPWPISISSRSLRTSSAPTLDFPTSSGPPRR